MFTKTASLTFQQGKVFARLVEEEEKQGFELMFEAPKQMMGQARVPVLSNVPLVNVKEIFHSFI